MIETKQVRYRVRGREILRTMKDTCALPVIVKPVTERALPNEIQPLLARDALADDLYALAYHDPALRVGGGRQARADGRGKIRRRPARPEIRRHGPSGSGPRPQNPERICDHPRRSR